MQEFQVNASNYSAEYGRAAGGVINTVTRSGGNAIHGELFFYDRDNNLGAENPYTTLTTQVAGTNNFVTYPYKPKDWRKQWGFGAGGPLLRDKLFWFYSYDQSQRNFPGTARASDPTDTFSPADPGAARWHSPAPAAASSYGDQGACGIQAAFGVSPIRRRASYYEQGLGVIASFLGQVPRHSDQVLNFPKLDWQINDANRLTVQYNRLRYSSPAGVRDQASNFYGRSSFGNDFVKEDFGILRLSTVLSSNKVNSFLFQYGRDFEYESSQTPTPNELPLSTTIPGRSAAPAAPPDHPTRLRVRRHRLRHRPHLLPRAPRSAQRAPYARRGHGDLEPRPAHRRKPASRSTASSTTSTTSTKRVAATATTTPGTSSPTTCTPPPASATPSRRLHAAVLLFQPGLWKSAPRTRHHRLRRLPRRRLARDAEAHPHRWACATSTNTSPPIRCPTSPAPSGPAAEAFRRPSGGPTTATTSVPASASHTTSSATARPHFAAAMACTTAASSTRTSFRPTCSQAAPAARSRSMPTAPTTAWHFRLIFASAAQYQAACRQLLQYRRLPRQASAKSAGSRGRSCPGAEPGLEHRLLGDLHGLAWPGDGRRSRSECRARGPRQQPHLRGAQQQLPAGARVCHLSARRQGACR